MKKIGILGGMGPQASIHFYQMLIEKVKENISVPRNQDYPHLLLANIPVPDLIQGKDNMQITVNIVNIEAKALEKAGADFIVMPCNTMHLFEKEIMNGVTIPFISMIDCVVKNIQELKIKKVGLLGSSTTMQSQLYTQPLSNIGVQTIIPEEYTHNNISQIIQNYIAGTTEKSDIKALEGYCDELIKKGSEIIILGCTELPLILKDSFGKYNFLASSEILAENTLKYHIS